MAENKKQPYDIDNAENNWFKALPYAFKAYVDDSYKIFYLPISPQNITVVTHFANNAIATLTSTVEEHAQQRYFDISIQGTTGFAPKYIEEIEESGAKNNLSSNAKGRRLSYSVDMDISKMGFGLASRSLSIANQLADTAKEIVTGRQHKVGVFNDNNGYIAFHNFYRFLLRYKAGIEKFTKDKPKDVKNGNLIFVNYKDNIQYSCIIQRFVLERSADNPLLYNYSMQLRAYNLKNISDNIMSSDFTDGIMALAGMKDKKESMATFLKNKASKIKNLVNGALAGIGTAGR